MIVGLNEASFDGSRYRLRPHQFDASDIYCVSAALSYLEKFRRWSLSRVKNFGEA